MSVVSTVLHHVRIGDPTAKKLVFVLHGILGSGSNFRSLIKRLNEQRPECCFVLVDLRLHGRSLNASPPHTLAACVQDLTRLSEQLERAPEAVLGHSFGGKVALCYAAQRPIKLEQVWVLDSYPGPHEPNANHEVARVIEALKRAPVLTDTRDEFIKSLTEQGLSLGIARWLSQNLERTGEGYHFRLDLAAISELLADYFRQDLWPIVETPPPGQEVCLVIAERSHQLNAEARAQLAELAHGPQVHRFTLANAGHWLHVDNPDGLLALLEQHLLP
jgi:pimeloyl-ACP methyl ester carboxylesterase